jgi:hypothetical protein
MGGALMRCPRCGSDLLREDLVQPRPALGGPVISPVVYQQMRVRPVRDDAIGLTISETEYPHLLQFDRGRR